MSTTMWLFVLLVCVMSGLAVWLWMRAALNRYIDD